MKYKIYKLEFSTEVHFGDNSLEDSNYTFTSDRLFSALCIEALILYGEEGIQRLVALAKDNKLLLSDAMPYVGDTLFLKKPTKRIITEQEGNSVLKKLYKNLMYIPLDSFKTYLQGDLDVSKATAKLKQLGKSGLKVKVAKSNDVEQEPKPYYIGTYKYNEDCGVYFILGYENEDDFCWLDDIMLALGYDGIGGKISSGYGKFIATPCDVPFTLLDLIHEATSTAEVTSLSLCLPNDNEIEKVIQNSNYTMQRCGGFIASTTYSDTPVKKNDLYAFASGSCFKAPFEGDVYDVSNDGAHPVYKYAKPFFIGV